MTEQHPSRIDPEVLAEKARAFLGLDGSAPPPLGSTTIEKILLHTYSQVAEDLATLRWQHRMGREIDVAPVLAALRDEKIAAMLLLAKYTLLDVAACPRETLDFQEAHHDIALYTEFFFRGRAADALAMLYDFAFRHERANPQFWRNVYLRCLFLLALLQDSCPQITMLVAARPTAPQHLTQLIETSQPAIAEQCRRLMANIRARDTQTPYRPAPYVTIHRQSDPDPGLNYGESLGACSIIAAGYAMRAAVNDGDFPKVLRWFVEGSSPTVRALFAHTRAQMPLWDYATFLQKLLARAELADVVRLAAAVVELGALNRESRPEGGDPDINQLLVEQTMTENEERTPITRLAVRELATVKNLQGLLFIADQAPLIPVAEEALTALKEMRRLHQADQVVARRPALMAAYRAAHRQLVEIQNLVEAVWSSPSDEMTRNYIERLRALNAGPELEKLARLARRPHALLLDDGDMRQPVP